MLILGRFKDRDALRRATRNTDIVHGTANEFASVCHQHDLIFFFHGERTSQIAIALIDDHGDDAFTATPGDAVFIT